MPDARVLMVVTNVDRVPGTDIRTGFFLRELTHPYFEAHEAGFEVDVASIDGGAAPVDPHSDPREPHSKVQDDIISMGFLHSPRHAAKIENTLKLSDVDVSAYDAILFAGGAGAIFDLPEDATVARQVAAIWDAGNVVAAVCHGSGALLNVRMADGRYLVDGQEVSGLSTQEERNIQKAIPAFTPPILLEDEIPRRGGLFRAAAPDVPFAVTSGGGRLVSGQNNASGTLAGRALVAAVRRLKGLI